MRGVSRRKGKEGAPGADGGGSAPAAGCTPATASGSLGPTFHVGSGESGQRSQRLRGAYTRGHNEQGPFKRFNKINVIQHNFYKLNVQIFGLHYFVREFREWNWTLKCGSEIPNSPRYPPLPNVTTLTRQLSTADAKSSSLFCQINLKAEAEVLRTTCLWLLGNGLLGINQSPFWDGIPKYLGTNQ